MAAVSKTMKEMKEMMVSSLPLEEYMIVSDNPFHSRFTLFHLNKVLSIHGLAKVHDQSKFAVAHALNNVDLMTAERSTLLEMVSPMSFPGVDEVQDDMEALGWEECGVQSIAHLRSEEEARLVADINSIWSAIDGGAPATAAASAPPLAAFPDPVRRSRSKKKTKRPATAAASAPPLVAFPDPARRSRSKKKTKRRKLVEVLAATSRPC